MARAIISETRSPSTIANDTTIGAQGWMNPANAGESDDVYTYSAGGQYSFITYYLKCTDFGYSIPENSSIEGIEVGIERHRKSEWVHDYSLRLVKGGVIGGDDKAEGTYWPRVDDTAVYGDSDDLWGLTFEASDINTSGFGVVLSALMAIGGYAYVDHIYITAYYKIFREEQVIIINDDV